MVPAPGRWGGQPDAQGPRRCQGSRTWVPSPNRAGVRSPSVPRSPCRRAVGRRRRPDQALPLLPRPEHPMQGALGTQAQEVPTGLAVSTGLRGDKGFFVSFFSFLFIF